MSVVLCDRLTDMRAARRLTATKLYNPSPGVGGRGTYTRGQSVITPQIRVFRRKALLLSFRNHGHLMYLEEPRLHF
jgi:hypothetical protein